MDPQELLEAHVAFELARWTGDAWREQVSGEVDALFGWLATVPVADLATADSSVALRRAAVGALRDPAVRDGAATALVEAVDAALPDDLTVADLVSRGDYDRAVGVVVAMTGVRNEVIRQVTTSQAYSNLLAHVLYHGLKAYVLTENVVARKVPGASSLVRIGQAAVKTAAPRLEKGIDRQLTSFVEANISDNIRESRRYLESALDEDVLRTVADEVWASNAHRPLTDARELTGDVEVATAVDLAADVLSSMLADGPVADMIDAGAEEWFRRNGSRPAADVLADLGVTADSVRDPLLDLLAPGVATAVSTGYVEERIRERLAPFYATL